MNRPTLFAVAAGVALVAAAVPVVAHHAFAAEFDRSRTITVTGNVTKLEWTNPHARLFVEGPDETGKTQVWDFELGPPNGLMRNGWRRDSLKPGHKVTVEGFRSKTSTVVANARSVKMSDGRQVLAGSSFDTGPTQ
jgi:Family of unknown function (DUF6152)